MNSAITQQAEPRTGRVYTEHNNDSEAWCPYSGDPAPADSDDSDQCPQFCEESGTEEDETPDLTADADSLDSPASLATRTAAAEASATHARSVLQLAAGVVRQMLPTAATVTFAESEYDGDISAKLVIIRDTAGLPLWFDNAAREDDATAAQLSGQVSLGMDLKVRDALERALADVCEYDREALDYNENGNRHNWHDVNLAEALAWQNTPRAIDLNLLSLLLSRATAILDVEDVPGLMEALRVAATAPARWKFPTHNNERGNWCQFSGMFASLGKWSATGNTRCGHDCPGSDALPVTG